MSIKTNFISEHILHVSNGASAIWWIKHICHILFNASQQCPYWQKAIFNRPCTPAGLTLQLLPRENGLFCIKLLSAVHKNLIFSPTKHTASQVNCYVAGDTFISLEFRANPIINNLHTGHITAVRQTFLINTVIKYWQGQTHTHTQTNTIYGAPFWPKQKHKVAYRWSTGCFVCTNMMLHNTYFSQMRAELTKPTSSLQFPTVKPVVWSGDQRVRVWPVAGAQRWWRRACLFKTTWREWFIMTQSYRSGWKNLTGQSQEDVLNSVLNDNNDFHDEKLAGTFIY